MRNARRSIFIITLILLMFGVVMIYSSSAIYANERFGDSLFFLKKHLLYLSLGFAFMIYMMLRDLATIEKSAKIIMILSITLLVLVAVPHIGFSASGARRWLRLGSFFSFQPAEFTKFALILYLADFLARKGYRIKDFFTGYLPCILTVCLATFLILLQPDLGTAFSVFFIGTLIIFTSGGRATHLAATILAGLPFLYFLIFRVPYRRKRIFVFFNPWPDRDGSGFQIVQSFLALGSGGLLGVGLGQSKQKLFYLPESHTDFIFSIIGEELGFLGAAAVLLLFGIFVALGMHAFLKEHRPFNKILIFGITGMIAFEALVNIGVSIGAFPTKGLPLPFISYGGTSLLFHMGAVGLMLNAMRE